MQLLMGVSMWEYWLGNLLWDLVMLWLPISIEVLVLHLSGSPLGQGETGIFSLLMLFGFGFSFISLT